MAAFQLLAAEVKQKIIDGHDVTKMSSLREQYVNLLDQAGIRAPEYRSEKLKVRLQKQFGDSISFWYPKHRSQSELVYSEDVPKGQVVEACHSC